MKTEDKIFKSVFDFYCKKKFFEKNQNQFKKSKQEFYKDMDNFNVEDLVVKSDKYNLKVTKVQTVKIKFLPKKLKKKLDKKVYNSVVNKSYTIDDFEGMVSYLKDLGADPKIFKSFISVKETVDESKINQLSEIGVIDDKDIKSCYVLIEGKPYYKVKEVREDDQRDAE